MKKIALYIVACSVLFFACKKEEPEDKNSPTEAVNIFAEVATCWKGLKNVPEVQAATKLGTKESVKTNCSKDEIKKAKADAACQLVQCKAAADWADYSKRSEDNCPDPLIKEGCINAIFNR